MTMSNLTRFERMDDLFPELFRRFMRPTAFPSALANFDAPGEIRVDVSENDNGYEVRAEVPGFKKEDIRVSIDGSYVSISAESRREKGGEKEEKTGKGERTLVKELYWGSASRSFTLPHEVDDKSATAKYEDGVLKLSLPKKTEASRRTLSIE
jgi:HSP20 family protein